MMKRPISNWFWIIWVFLLVDDPCCRAEAGYHINASVRESQSGLMESLEERQVPSDHLQDEGQKGVTRIDQCMACHEVIGDKHAEEFKRDVHYKKGISCSGCHGGDDREEEMEQAMAVEKGFMGVPKGDAITRTCARCHASSAIMVNKYESTLLWNQADALAGSVHGKRSITGEENITNCSTCHGAHGIVSVKNPQSPVHPLSISKTCASCHADAAYMRSYNPALPVDQLEKYRTSRHGIKNVRGDAKAAACANCHGSHDIRPSSDVKSRTHATNLPTTCGSCHSDAVYMRGYRIPSDQVKKFTSSVHGQALLEKHDLAAPSCNDCHGNHGATPPGVQSVSKVCGTCHALNDDLFSSSPHKKAFDARRLPECETCHGYHEIVAATDRLLGVSNEAVCSRCHQENLNTKGYLVAKTLRELIDSLEQSEATADSLLSIAERKGMEVSESRFRLRDVRQARLQSRTMVHAFDETKFREVVDGGLQVASTVATEGQHAIDEYYFRRWGLGVATLIISAVAGSLYLTIRRIEKRQLQKQE